MAKREASSNAWLLDTQVVVTAAVDGLEGLPQKVQKLLQNESATLLLSSVSVMEIALKNNLGKLKMSSDNLKQAARDMRLSLIGFLPHHADRLFSLPAHHQDQFDRMLIATALGDNIPLVGDGRVFRKYKGLQVIW
jgi:PIN domain nuclease of toxin-antitoxin system